MSIGEIIVVLIVLILVTKPEDLSKLFSIFYKIKKYFNNIHEEVAKYALEIKKETIEITEEEKINIYLARIIDLGYKYQGELDLENIKQFYYTIIKNKYEDTNRII